MVRLAMIGGALGSGKTTTIIELGKKLTKDFKKKVVIITNDQGEVLVDAKTAKDHGFTAAEILRGCFCCKFPDFMASAHELLATADPDIILAEPVGSCIDIPATVCNPIQKYYKDEFTLAPLIILIDALRILDFSRKSDALSPKSPNEYLYQRQIQEGEVIAINKTDLVTPEELESVKAYVKKLNSRAEILTFSAKTDDGLDNLLDLVLNGEYSPYTYPEIDYDTYATAEAELGWFNGTWDITSDQEFDAKKFVRDLLVTAAENVGKIEGDVAHLKVHLTTDKGSVKASLVMQGEDADFTGKIEGPVQKGSVIMNARVMLEPEDVTKCVKEALDEVAAKQGLTYENWEKECFKPGYPKPYYQLRVDFGPTSKASAEGDKGD